MKILIVDDHDLIRAGLRNVLTTSGHQVVAETNSIEAASEFLLEASNTFADVRCDVAIIDHALPDGIGLEFIRRYSQFFSDCAFILLTADMDESLLRLAQEAGAAAYINKSEPLSHLLRVISQLSSMRLAPSSSQNPQSALSAREVQVLTRVAAGARSIEIASLLFISEATVKSHLASINRKLGASNRTMALAKAKALGIL